MQDRKIKSCALRRSSLYCTVLALILNGCAAWFVGDDPEARRTLAQQWTNDAFALLQNNDTSAARKKLISAVELDPTMANARDALGILLMIEGKYADALVQFEWATAEAPDVSLFHYHLAIAHIALDSVGFATPALNRALELDPDSQDIRRSLLDAYLLLGRWDRAERLLVELTQAGYDTESLLLADGMIAFANEDLDRAQARFTQAAKLNETSPAPAAALGLMYETQGFFDRAEAAYKAALKRAPDDPYVNLVMADLYHKTGRYSSADHYLRRTMLKPEVRQKVDDAERARVYHQIADVGFQTGKYRTSQLYQKRAVELLPALKETEIGIDSAAHFALGTIEAERDNVDAAIREFKLAVKGSPNFVLAWVRLGEAMLLKAGLSPLRERQTLLTNARKSAQKAQEIAPRNALGYYLEGKVLVATADLMEGAFRGGALREAVFAFQQAKNAENPPPDIAIFQATILSDLASHVEAAEALGQAIKDIPDQFELNYLRATELIKAKKYKEARVVLSEAYRIDPNQDDLGAAMSLVLFKLGDIENSIAAMDWEPGKGPLPGILAAGNVEADL